MDNVPGTKKIISPRIRGPGLSHGLLDLAHMCQKEAQDLPICSSTQLVPYICRAVAQHSSMWLSSLSL